MCVSARDWCIIACTSTVRPIRSLKAYNMAYGMHTRIDQLMHLGDFITIFYNDMMDRRHPRVVGHVLG